MDHFKNVNILITNAFPQISNYAAERAKELASVEPSQEMVDFYQGHQSSSISEERLKVKIE